jgi:hypothetical protein
MRKNKEIYLLVQVVIILLIIVMSSCEKANTNDYRQFLGTWISTDVVDTLDFTSDHDFSKNKTPFNYSISGDSITIQYNGPLMIYIKPTTHFYILKGNELTIYISKWCYGFRQQKTKYIRK